MNIKVLGAGCTDCRQLEATVREAVNELAIPAEVEQVTDFKKMMSYGLTAMPGVVVNEKLVCAGRIPTKAEITSWITTGLCEEE